MTLAAFNYQVDPNHRYRFSVSEDDLIKLTRSEDLVLMLPRNYDDRALLKKFVPIARPARIMVLGGSRALNLHEHMFVPVFASQFLNLSVMAGTVRDYVALWHLAWQEGQRPEYVLICVEEQSINWISQNNRYLSIYEHYTAFFQTGVSLRRLLMGHLGAFKDMLSLETTLASARMLMSPTPKTGLILKRDRNPARHAKTASFAMLYPDSYEQINPDKVDIMAQGNGRGELEVFRKWNRLDRRGLNHLRALVQDIQRTGAKPILIGMPYHPKAYQIIAKDADALSALQSFVEDLAELAEMEGVPFYDGILKYGADFKREDFFDGVHLKVRSNHRLLESMDRNFNLGIVDKSGKRYG